MSRPLVTTRLRDPLLLDVDDNELAREIANGQRESFTILYRRHVDRVFGLITRILGPGHEREDLVQEIFHDLYRGLRSFRGDAKLSTYLYRIAVHTATDYLRGQRRHKTTSVSDEAWEALVNPETSPLDRAQKRQELVETFELLATLKPKKRIAFVLAAVQGLSLAEIGVIVGAEPDAVKQRVLHARRELAQKLEHRQRRDPT